MTIDLSADVVARLRARLRDVGYTVEGVRDLLGPLAHAALHRNETTPGLVETANRTPLATLVRLWLLQAPVPRAQAATALPDLLEPLVAAGILHGAGQEVRALVDVRPYGAVGDVDDPSEPGCRLVGAGRPHARHGRRPADRAARPCSRRQQRRDDSRPVDRTRARRQGTRHRHRLRRPGPPSHRPRRPHRRHRRQRTCARDDPAHRRAQRHRCDRAGRRHRTCRPARAAGGQPVRTRRRRDVRPDRVEPAVRHLAARRAHLSRQRHGGRRGLPPDRRGGAAPPVGGRGLPDPRQLAARAGRGLARPAGRVARPHRL